MSIDVDVAAAHVRLRLGLLQHICKTLRWVRGRKLSSMASRIYSFTMEITGQALLQNKDGNWSSDSTALKRGQTLVWFDLRFSGVYCATGLTLF